MSNRVPIALACTVGGSGDPIRTAITQLRPEIVWFVVSDNSSGKSSRSEVEDAGGHAEHAKQHGVRETQVVEVPADNPDRALALIGGWLGELRSRFPDHSLVADYTGGTKSMSAALLMAALGREGTEVQFMSGRRPDLVRIERGTERPQRISSDFVFADRQMELARSLAREWSYSAALDLLEKLEAQLAPKPRGSRPPRRWMTRLAGMRRACLVLSHWDAFRHKDAQRILSTALDDGMPGVEACFGEAHAAALASLAATPGNTPTWRLCADLCRNAERLARRGRYDDAVARLYRLAEACVQARLHQRWKLRSGALPVGAVPEDLRGSATPRRDPRTGSTTLELPMMKTLELIERMDPKDALVAAWDRRDGRLASPPWQGNRNKSILAHGFRPVGEETWKEAKAWIDARLAPFWKEEDVPQLPVELPP